MNFDKRRLARFALNAAGMALDGAARIASKVTPLQRRYHIAERLGGSWPKGPCLWLHGASLGECKMLLNLARSLQRDLSASFQGAAPRFLITTQKVEVLPYLEDRARGTADVAMAPADTPVALAAFVKQVQPQALVLGENELWPGYLSVMSRTSLRPSVALVSGRYRRCAPGADFSAIGFASMQTEADCRRISEAAGRSRLNPVVGGDWKLLGLLGDESSVSSSAVSDKDVDLALLSVHFPEWESLFEVIRVCKLRNQSVVLVPRCLEEVELFRHELQVCNVKTVDWPQVRQGGVSLVDRFGLTGQVLERSKLAFVGGSFCPKPGIHDFWEPLMAGVPACVGPYSNGHEDLVNELVQGGVLSRLAAPSDFENLDLVSKEQVQGFLSIEKEKVSSSYQQLLLYLEDLLK